MRLTWAGVFPSSSSRAASLPGRMPVNAPQAGVTPVMLRAALKKLSFTAFCRRRSRSYSSVTSRSRAREVPRPSLPPWAISVTAVAYTGPWCRSTRAQLSSPSPGS